MIQAARTRAVPWRERPADIQASPLTTIHGQAPTMEWSGHKPLPMMVLPIPVAQVSPQDPQRSEQLVIGKLKSKVRAIRRGEEGEGMRVIATVILLAAPLAR